MGAGIQWQRIAQRLVGVSVDLDLVGRQAALRSDSHGSHPVRVGAADFYIERRGCFRQHELHRCTIRRDQVRQIEIRNDGSVRQFVDGC